MYMSTNSTKEITEPMQFTVIRQWTSHSSQAVATSQSWSFTMSTSTHLGLNHSKIKPKTCSLQHEPQSSNKCDTKGLSPSTKSLTTSVQHIWNLQWRQLCWQTDLSWKYHMNLHHQMSTATTWQKKPSKRSRTTSFLCSSAAQKSMPMHLWCQLLPQVECQLLLLWQSQVNPGMLTYAHVYQGQQDYSNHPLSQLEWKQWCTINRTREEHLGDIAKRGMSWAHHLSTTVAKQYGWQTCMPDVHQERWG